MPTQIGENRAKQMLKSNELVLCMGVNQLRTPNIAMIAAACGFDAVYIDLEHNPTSLETAAGVCVAALAMGITPIARVTSHDPHDATRILDCGAQGVMVPHVQNAAEARAIVEACLYARRVTARHSAAVHSSVMPRSLYFPTILEEGRIWLIFGPGCVLAVHPFSPRAARSGGNFASQ
jgi:2-keto-3-deoxy-L-rhamnonate aldolase RhmA